MDSYYCNYVMQIFQRDEHKHDSARCFSWYRQQYGTELDYLWNDWNAILRHTDNNKWYGIIVEELRSMKLKEAAKEVEDGIEEMLTYRDLPSEHWTRSRTVVRRIK